MRRLDGVPPLLVFRLVVAIRNFFVRLIRRLVPARVAFFELFIGVWFTQMMYAAAKLGIADKLVDGPKTADELARATNANPDSLARLMRALVSVGIFERRRDQRFALNRLAEPLRSDCADSMRDIVMFLGSEHSMLGWSRFYDAIKTGKNGFSLAHGKGVFDYFAEHPEEEAIFNGGMVNMTELDAPGLVRGYDYSKFTKICDVAGGRGTLLAAILSVNPKLQGVLFDVGRVVDQSAGVLAAWGVADRCTTAAGSFFESVPSGCDAYILKEILHDWDDARALEILGVCRKAMQPGATLLVLEMVIVDDNRPHPGKLLDLEMLDIANDGRQRDADELGRLFEQSGFRFRRVVSVPGASSIVEAVAV